MSHVIETYAQIKAHADEIKDHARQIYPTMSPQEAVWQGDLGIQHLGKEFNTSALKPCDVPEQLVEGDSEGSNHRLGKKFPVEQAWRPVQSSTLLMYVLYAPKGLEILHGSVDGVATDTKGHGDIECHEGGFYAIRAQRQYAEELRRARD